MITADHGAAERDGTPLATIDYTVADRVDVTFTGAGAGSGPLSWGQLDILTTMRKLETALPTGGVIPLSPGTTEAAVGAELRYLMSRYPAMRTRVGTDTDGAPTQVVAGEGTIGLDIVDAAGRDPRRVAESVCQTFRKLPFDHGAGWPVRMAVIRDGAACTHMASLMSHFAIDGVGGAIMMREVPARVTTPAGGTQPLDQARWQASPPGQRQNTAALRHWDALLRAMPPLDLGALAGPRQPRHHTGVLRSRALAMALPAAAARTGLSSAAVLTTVYALAFTRITGVTAFPVRPVVSNRFRPGLADVVSPVSQHGLCVIDTTGGSFDDVAERTQRATMTAYKYAYYDRTLLDELIGRVVADRGPGLDIDCNLNDRRPSAPGGPVATPGEIRDAVTRTSFRWTHAQDTPSSRLFVKVDEVDDAVELMVHVDSHFLAPERAEELLRAVESVAVRAAG